MPSWSIHTAHVERLFAEHEAQALGIDDANCFLFGNYVPDIYLGFMVHDTSYRIDYCLTHLARPAIIPVPDADKFWDECINHPVRRPKSPAAWSLTLGAWVHLQADRVYNQRFREFCQSADVPDGDELRRRKQADFAVFGRSLGASMQVVVTPELLAAARDFRPYSILPGDVERTVDVARAITAQAPDGGEPRYQLLDASWMAETFEACQRSIVERLAGDMPDRPLE